MRGSLLISEVKDMAAEDILGARRDWPCIEGEGEWFMIVSSEWMLERRPKEGWREPRGDL